MRDIPLRIGGSITLRGVGAVGLDLDQTLSAADRSSATARRTAIAAATKTAAAARTDVPAKLSVRSNISPATMGPAIWPAVRRGLLVGRL